MISIRAATIGDVPAIVDIYNESILNNVATFDTEPKTVEQQEVWFRAHDARHPVIVAESEGRVIGWASLNPYSDRKAYDDTCETSFYVHADFRGQGVGRELKRAIIAEAERVGMHVLLARVTEGNDVSIHLNLEYGFEVVGVLREVGFKFGRRLDVVLMQKVLGN